MKKAVLFDLDGVLLDSMPYHVIAWQQIFKRFDVPLKDEDIYPLEGTPTPDMVRILSNKFGLHFSEAEIKALMREKSALYNQITQAKLISGATDLIYEFKKRKLRLAIVTGTLMENLRHVISVDILRQFDTFITGSDVTNGKPHPEPYLKAAAKLEVEPSECLVIENAALGVESARAAGMMVIAVTTTQTADQLSGAHQIFPNLEEIRKQINELLAVE